MDEFPYPNCGSVIKIKFLEKIETTNGNIYNAREEMMNILSYVDSEKLCNINNFFLNWIKKLWKKVLISLSNQFQETFNGKVYHHEIESCVEQIDTRTHHEFTIDQRYFKIDSIFNTGNKIRMTCSDSLKRQH